MQGRILMKILIVNKFLYPNGGAETYIFEIGRQLKEMGHEVQYFGMEHEGRVVGNHAESYTSNMDFHTGKLAKLLYPFKIIYSKEARHKIKAVLDDFKPDVVHLNNFTYQITPSVLYEIRKFEKQNKHPVKIVATVHDPQLVCPNHMLIHGTTGKPCELCLSGQFRHCAKGKCIHGSTVKSILGMVESRLYRSLHTYRMIDTVICPSYFIESKLKANPDIAGRTKMLRNFISVSKPTGQKADKPYVLYFGRYSEEKGIHTLVKAAKELPEISFVFAGRGPFEDEVNVVSNIENKGFTTGSALADLIANASFSLIASECFENCPFSVMESQMLGTPVIGADIGGIPELIREGVDGELFKSGSVEELKIAIQNLYNDTERIKQYTKACREISYDSLQVYCEKLLEVYQV